MKRLLQLYCNRVRLLLLSYVTKESNINNRVAIIVQNVKFYKTKLEYAKKSKTF